MFISEMTQYKKDYIKYLRKWMMIRNRVKFQFPMSFADFAYECAAEEYADAKAWGETIQALSSQYRYA